MTAQPAPGLARLGALLAAAALIGCASDPPAARLSFATTEPDVVSPRVLRRIVVGRSCFTRDFISAILTPPWSAQRADQGQAIAAALEGVEGANVLTNVRLRVEIQQYLLFSRVCAIVSGDAGVIE